MARKNNQKKEQDIDFNIPTEIEKITFTITPLKFKSKKQKEFFDLCRSDDTKLLICDGPAGTGKSLLSIYAALKLIKAGKYKRLMYVRTPIDSSDNGLGYMPGSLYEKSIHYMMPLDEKISKLVSYDDIKKLHEHDVIESTVNTFMRGRSIDDTIVIIDEIQNFSMSEIKTLLTRFEENTKIIGLGDKGQSDIGLKSCLNKLVIMFSHDEYEENRAKENGVFTFKFDIGDVVRSGLTKYIIEIFDKSQKISRGS